MISSKHAKQIIRSNADFAKRKRGRKNGVSKKAFEMRNLEACKRL